MGGNKTSINGCIPKAMQGIKMKEQLENKGNNIDKTKILWKKQAIWYNLVK